MIGGVAATPRWFWIAVLAAVLLGAWLRLPVVEGGFRTDDYVQVSALRGRFAVPRDSTDLYRFDGRTPTEQAALRAQGYHPWWAREDLRLAMWRPLPSLLLAMDFSLFGLDARAYHLHGMFWWVLLVVTGALVFRQLLPLRAAAAATCLWALDECHNVPLSWLANRSTLIAGTLACLALWLHLRAQRSGEGALLASIAPALALCAGEYAFPVLGFIVAHALYVGHGHATERGSLASRLRVAAPTLVAAALYLTWRALTGHAIRGSGFYLSPLHAPLDYARAAVDRLPDLLGHALWGLPVRLPGYGVWREGAGWLAIAVMLGLVVRGRRSEASGDRLRGFLALGVLAAVLPAAGALPEPRVALGASFGCAALWGGALEALAMHTRRALTWAPLLAIVALHPAQDALIAEHQARGFSARSRVLTRHCLDAPLPEVGAEDAQVYLVSAADFTTAANLVYARDVHGLPQPAFYRQLSAAQHAHDLRRVGPRSLEVTVLSSRLQGAFVGTLYRDLGAPLRSGTRVRLPGLEVSVLAALEGQPWKLRFDFDRTLDDPTLWLMQQTAEGLKRIRPPASGESLRIPRPRPPR